MTPKHTKSVFKDIEEGTIEIKGEVFDAPVLKTISGESDLYMYTRISVIAGTITVDTQYFTQEFDFETLEKVVEQIASNYGETLNENTNDSKQPEN